LIESTLGLTAFEFITRYLTNNGVLPGFVDGYSRIHHDEQRHIGYGVWYLREAAQRDPALAGQIPAKLLELLPAVASALAPPDSGDTDWEALGASSEEIRAFALSGLTRRLNIIGCRSRATSTWPAARSRPRTHDLRKFNGSWSATSRSRTRKCRPRTGMRSMSMASPIRR
jgi:hypothetical protein